MDKERFLRLLSERILILDGGMGTMIQGFNLGEEDYRGDRFADFPGQLKGNNDLLCLTRPDVIRSIHRQYLDAGADIFTTNTFNANAISMADYGMERYVSEINLAAGRLARELADSYMAEHPGRTVLVAGSVGPTNKTASMSPDVNDPAYRAVTYKDLFAAYEEQITALVESGVDIILFDIQDVGLRYYTYLSSMHYMMEACAENHKPMIVLDRPNPNGFYVDGPILEAKHRSFVGMHPIPVVHGMTLGELARMINGEGWLAGGETCTLTVIPCLNYTHQTRYKLPTRPSPNLPNMRSIYLYSSLCFLEGTPVSVGRGTDTPFQIFGHPKLQGMDYTFTPQPNEGSKNPPLKGLVCRGMDLRQEPSDSAIWARGVDLSYVIECYRQLGGEKFFLPIFDKLTGTDYVREMIVAGADAQTIRSRWEEDVERFRQTRKPYLLYEE